MPPVGQTSEKRLCRTWFGLHWKKPSRSSTREVPSYLLWPGMWRTRS